ncbi:serine/threonine protein kinase [Actinocorallia herbida]|uniref:non-specific serine/threonine protein kinase n=1 Tax=Actinocorallia herbida TaxID=58109 RepID=A0A3N1CTG2_9ACTN|nr:protein kinase [Actinocorallia herbida]ROO84602.1 serine/threonine protein kinase [Actinocorallia herbida]
MAFVNQGGGELVGGRYRLVESVGEGAMGRVWRGHDDLLDRQVAVKEIVLPQGIVAEQRDLLARRVMREARSAARLNHPGIVTVHDLVEHRGAPMVVMEFVGGGSLGALLRAEGRLPFERVSALGLSLCDALAEAHGSGVVHRDLKPDNILLRGDRAVITDFGIASLADATALTSTGTKMGTPLYMAPEQVEGGKATAAADMWSVGATLYAAVEGRTPFAAPTLMALFNAILSRPHEPCEHAGPLGPVLSRLLAKDPADRPSAEQAAALLTEALRPAPGPMAAPAPVAAPVAPPSPAPAPSTKAPSARREPGLEYGTVKWFNSDKGFGFLTPDDGGADVFAHYSEIQAKGFRDLSEGQRVSYRVRTGKHGPQAQKITVLAE